MGRELEMSKESIECKNCEEYFTPEHHFQNICYTCMWFVFNGLNHEGYKPERAKIVPNGMGGYFNILENAFAIQWKEECSREPRINGGQGILDCLVQGEVTQRDAHVAASVIQWLGTNCGQSFLHEVDKRIKRTKKELEQKDNVKSKLAVHVFPGM